MAARVGSAPPNAVSSVDPTAAAAGPGSPGEPTQAAATHLPLSADAAALAPPEPKLPSNVPASPAPDAATTAAPAPATDRKTGTGGIDAAPGLASRPADNAAPWELTDPTVALSPVPTTAAAVSAAPAHPTSAAAPLQQLAPALLTLAKTADGNQQMTIRLHPAELGMVQVRIERALSGSTVEITAEKSDTLRALQQDQPQLHRMLNEAGIPAAGRTVTFHVAQPAQASAGSSGSGQGSAQGGAQQGGGQQAGAARTNGGSANDGGTAGSGRGGYPTRETNTWSGGRRQSGSSTAAGVDPTATGQSYHIGLDITA
jgi:flagellar hook-length control protein FliK